MKVTVLCGGTSEEQHASRNSGQSVAKALSELGHTPVIVEYDEHCIKNIRDENPDAVFHIVQGKNHGDGCVQAILELLGIPYTGSRPAAAAIINHKTVCKRLWDAWDVRTPAYFELTQDQYAQGYEVFVERAEREGVGMPVVVKAPTQGSRFGMVFVEDEASFAQVKDVFGYDSVLLCERFVEGSFITQGVIEIDGKLTPLPPAEIIDSSDKKFKVFYGAELEYRAAPLTPEQMGEINQMSIRASKCVGASGYARLDYHLSGGQIYLLEINAVPGLRSDYSDLLKCATLGGYDYNALIALILQGVKK